MVDQTMKIELSAQRRIRGTKWHVLIKLARLMCVFKNTGIALSFPFFESRKEQISKGVITHLTPQSIQKISYHDLYDLCDYESRVMSHHTLDEQIQHIMMLICTLRKGYTTDQMSEYVQKSQFVIVLSLDGGRMASTIYHFCTNVSWKSQIPISSLKYLNSQGYLWGPASNRSIEEQHVEYKKQIITRFKLLLELEQQLMLPDEEHETERDPILRFFTYTPDEVIPVELFMAPSVTKELSMYDIQVLYAPGFFSLKNLPLSTFGITYTVDLDDIDLTFIQISSLMKNRRNIGSVSRRELIVHECIHAARVPLHSHEYEEELAYHLSTSFIRRVFAPVTRRQRDTLLFTMFSAVSIISDFPTFPRWFALFTKFPVFFTIIFAMYRLFSMKRRLRKAQQYFKRSQVPEKHIMPIIFRLTDQEIDELATTNKRLDDIVNSRLNDMRWRVIHTCYLT
jgi:hypothetical protein